MPISGPGTAGPGSRRDAATPLSLRSFLLRGLLAGLVAGLAAFAVAYVVGEPSVAAAVALEDAGAVAHPHAGTAGDHPADEPATLVPRPLQATLGLATGTVVLGVVLGGFWSILTAFALGRVPGAGPRTLALGLAGIGWVAVHLVPAWASPANPPGVGDPATIGLRTQVYGITLAVSVVAAVAAVLAARTLQPRWGGWYAGLLGVAGYLVVVAVALSLLPRFDEVPAGFPATLLYRFRAAGLLTQVTLWAVLGVALAELTHRLVTRASRPSAPTGTAPSPISEA